MKNKGIFVYIHTFYFFLVKIITDGALGRVTLRELASFLIFQELETFVIRRANKQAGHLILSDRSRPWT